SIVEKMDLKRIAQRYGIELEERSLPTDADVEDVVSQRVTAMLEARLRERDKLHVERSQRFLPLARSLAESEDELAIIGMLLDDYYQESLHAPVPQPPAAAHPAAGAQREAGGRGRRPRRPRR